QVARSALCDCLSERTVVCGRGSAVLYETQSGAASMKPVRVGLVGSQFISTIHAEALKRVAGAELCAVVSPTGEHAQEFAARHGIRHHFRDYRKFLETSELALVVLGCPNDLHCEFAVLAAQAGKHVVCEKPLAPSLDEADRMIAACREAKVKLMYAEELCF